jgi:tRNA threonylcarbamoyladenosine biosynthesis protein TsaE
MQKEKIDLIVDAGELPRREASTVIDTTLVGGMILRKGDLEIEGVADSYSSSSPDETRDLAKRLLLRDWNRMRKKGVLFALSGDLGVGKTVFAQGVGEFLRIREQVVSPSYTLVNEYDYDRHGVSGKFFHIDPWRLGSFEEFLQLGFEGMLGANNVVVVEWASKFGKDVLDFCRGKGVGVVQVAFEDLGEDRRRLMIGL